MHKALLLFTTSLLIACLSCNRQSHSDNDELPATPHYADRTTQQQLIEQLIDMGNLAYDAPESFLARPDSFLNLLQGQPSTAEAHELYAWLLLNMAYGLREKGKIFESIRYYERALQYHQNHGMMEPDLVLDIAQPLANLYTMIGDLDKAILLHRMAIDLSKERQQYGNLTALYNNLAISHQTRGQADSVLATCLSGLQYTSPNSIEAAQLYSNMANSHEMKGTLDSAKFYNDRSISLLESAPKNREHAVWLASALALRSQLALQQEQTGAALTAIEKAIQIIEKNTLEDKNRDRAKMHLAHGDLLHQLRRFEEAYSAYQTAIALFTPETTELRFPDHTYTRALMGMARIQSARGLDSAIYYYAKAIENDYHSQQLITSKSSNYQNSQWSRSILTESMEALWNRYQNATTEPEKQELTAQMLWNIELSKGRQLLLEIDRSHTWDLQNEDTALQNARLQLQYLYEQLASTTDTLVKAQLEHDIAEIAFQFQLDEQHFEQQFSTPTRTQFLDFVLQQSQAQTLISYLIDPQGHSYCIWINQGVLAVKMIPKEGLEALDIPTFIRDYFADDYGAYEENPMRYQEAASKMATVLLPDNILEAAKNIVISNDGLLYGLPMDALMHDQQFLAATKNFSYTYTFLLNQKFAKVDTFQASINLFAKAEYQDSNLPDLQYVAKEKRNITRSFSTQLYEEQQANSQNFSYALSAPEIVHIAAHAIVEQGRSPYLSLHQNISLDQIRYTTIRTPLVVLSACHTASGELITAEGMESLNKTFLSKGVRGVVAANWPLNDANMPVIIKLFYEQLEKERHPAIALGNAKREFLSTADRMKQNPWFWASLNYAGVDSEIILQRKPYNLPWLFGGLVGIALLGLALRKVRKTKKPALCSTGSD